MIITQSKTNSKHEIACGMGFHGTRGLRISAVKGGSETRSLPIQNSVKETENYSGFKNSAMTRAT
jgi:hypothetical protein